MDLVVADVLGRTISHEDFINKLKNIHGSNHDYSNVKYINHRTKVEITCPIHQKVKQFPASCLSGTGCLLCNEDRNTYSRLGYQELCNKSHKGLSNLYIIKMYNDNESFYKIGITCTTLIKRYSGLKNYKYQKIQSVDNLKADLIYDLEKYLLNHYKNYKYTPRNKFGGSTECFSEIPLNYMEDIDNFIKTITRKPNASN